MKLHIISDIHLEFLPRVNSLSSLQKHVPSLYSKCDLDLHNITLILAGDIGYITMDNYWEFLKDCASKYKYVVCIKGNHEYYSSSYNYEELEEREQEKSSHIKNLHHLSSDKIELDGITFLGTTLWTHIPDQDRKAIQEQVKDYSEIYCSKIYSNNRPIDIDFTNKLHEEQMKWLQDNISTSNNIVVITHHVPLPELSHSKYSSYKNIMSSFVNTDLPQEIFSNKIKLWIAGHTHTSMEHTHNGIKFIVNPLGYRGENKKPSIYQILLDSSFPDHH